MITAEIRKKLISHRLRGFDKNDTTKSGLLKALSVGIPALEVDTRLTADDEIVLYHDARLNEHFLSNDYISNLRLMELKQIHYTKNSIDRILTLRELVSHLESVEMPPHIYLDIKESGAEEAMIKLLDRQIQNKKVTIISWLPETLFKVHEINPHIPLCFSYIPFRYPALFPAVRLLRGTIENSRWRNPERKRYFFLDQYNSPVTSGIRPGDDVEHYVSSGISGKMADVLSESGGFVCIHYSLSQTENCAELRKNGIGTILYSINDEKLLNYYIKHSNPDYILTDNAHLFQ